MVLLAILLVVVGAGVGPATTPAAAANGLDIDASYTYRFDRSGELTVEAAFTLKNVTGNTRRGNVITSYYYDGFAVPLPEDAVDVHVTDGERDLDFEVRVETFEPEEVDGETLEGGEVRLAEVSLRRRLNYGRSTDIVVTYRVAASAPRSEFIDRLNPAYGFFGVWGFGDPGRVDVRVELPPGYEVEQTGSLMARETLASGTRLTAEDIADPDEFWATIVARNDHLLTSTRVEVAGSVVTVRSWPDDDAWKEFAVEATAEGIPSLEEATGQTWPEDNTFEILQSSEPNFHGYAGWYDGEVGRITIDEQLDLEVFLHELSHAWFNDELTDDRWITEGLAQEMARLTANRLGEAIDPIDEADLSTSGRSLVHWSSGFNSDSTEEWGYTTSSFVMSMLTEEIGEEAMTDVVAALFDRRSVFPDEDGEGTSEQPVDWRRLLDVAHLEAGAEDFEQILIDHVVPARFEADLDDRTAALTDMERLAAASGDWFMPLGIRERAERWDFDDVERLVDEGLAVLDDRRELIERSEAAGLVAADVGEGMFERARDNYSSVEAELDERLTSIGVVEDITVRAAVEPSLVEQIGLWGQDPDAELLDVRSAYDADDARLVVAEADQLRALLDDAERVGEFRIKVGAAVAGGLLLMLVLLVVWRIRSRRMRRRERRQAEAKASTEDASSALEVGDLVGAP